jgi:hypothetical protein
MIDIFFFKILFYFKYLRHVIFNKIRYKMKLTSIFEDSIRKLLEYKWNDMQDEECRWHTYLLFLELCENYTVWYTTSRYMPSSGYITAVYIPLVKRTSDWSMWKTKESLQIVFSALVCSMLAIIIKYIYCRRN